MSFFNWRIRNPKSETPAPKLLIEDKDQSMSQLKSLFADFKSKNFNSSSADQDELLYDIVPLFYKIFSSTSGSDICEKFSDVFAFCAQISLLMVREIKKRATNQKTEEASLAIVQFLQPPLSPNSKYEDGKGWTLLSVLNILSRGPAPLIDCMISASLPSTLVKCLYIFFDLPTPDNNSAQPLSYESVFSLGSSSKCTKLDSIDVHRRNILLDTFKQVLQRICFYPATTEELVRKEDLRLLFGAVASWCPPHNSGWRKAAADVLQTIAHNGLSQVTIQHIYHKKLISQCLKNITKGGLQSLEIVDIFVTLFHLLRESSDINQMLLDDFRNSQGYAVIEDFLIKLEKEISNESEQDSIRSLIILIGKLTTCGYVELRPKQSLAQDIIYSIEGFELPMPLSKNESIRNFYAFNVLQSVFLHAETDFLCLRILEAIKTIYKQDPANYFILEPQNTFQTFSEKVCNKSPAVQEEFFSLIDCIVTKLNYVPVKEISSLTVIMKSCNISVTAILLVKTFIRLIDYQKIFKDILRDIGVLELCVNQLHTYAYTLQNHVVPDSDDSSITENDDLGLLLIDFLSLLISNTPKNVELFRKVGGTGCMYSLVNFVQSQCKALELMKVLTLSSGSEEDMSGFMTVLRSSNPKNVILKSKILNCLLDVLRESHRCRIVFRKVHSFVLIVQELVHLEGCFASPIKTQWESIERNDLIRYVKLLFSVLTMALKREPSNVRHFSTNVGYASLTEAVRNLGCFGTDVDLFHQDDIEQVSPNYDSRLQSHNSENCNYFEDIFNTENYDEIFAKCCPSSHQTLKACIMMKFIYNHATEKFSKDIILTNFKVVGKRNSKPCIKTNLSDPSLNVYENNADNIKESYDISTNFIIHPEAIICLLHLIPAINSDQIPIIYQLQLQNFIMSKIHFFFNNDRNIQILCDSVSMPQELLSCFRYALINEGHAHHELSLMIFESLASHKVCPKNVRDFLRLSDPLCCQPIPVAKDFNSSTANELIQNLSYFYSKTQRKNGGPVSLTRVKSLIGISSHTNPVNRVCIPLSNDISNESDYYEMRFTQVPSFIEFNMSHEGFSCLFLPSITPQSIPTGISAVNLVSPIESTTVGGIGIGERVFPPTGGFSYSTWFCVQKFSSPATAHPVRLLTIVRTVQGSNELISCLNISIVNSPHHTILVSTKEDVLSSRGLASPIESNSESVVEFPCESIVYERCWNHLVLTFQRSGMIKHSSCTCYLNGQLIDTKKLNYISSNISSSISSMGSILMSIHAYIGTPPSLHKISNLCWQQGPLHFIEDPLNSQLVSCVTRLGPNYVGNFQNPIIDYDQTIPQLMAEEKIVFSFYANNTSVLNLPRINKIYNEIDGSAIARQLHLHPKEKSSPIRIIHNAAGHLSGPARTLGAVLIGYEGIRSFNPTPLTKMLECVGGTNILLGILAMANNPEYLYAVVKAICSILVDNRSFLKDLEKNIGFKLFNFLLMKKRDLLSCRILSLLIELCGSLEQEFRDVKIDRETQIITSISSLNKSFNRKLFEEVICDLNLWIQSDNVDCSKDQLLSNVLRHINDFFKKCIESKRCAESSEKDVKTRLSSIIQFISGLNMIEKLVNLMMQFSFDPFNTNVTEPLSNLVGLSFTYLLKNEDIRRFGQFMIWTLPSLGTSETSIEIKENHNWIDDNSIQRNIVYRIEIRNICFKIILKVLDNTVTPDNVEPKFAEEIIKCLGFDWLLLFLQPDTHPMTVVLAMRVLMALLAIPNYTAKFRDGILCSGWLTGTDVVLKKRHGLLLMENGREEATALKEINVDSCHQPGFVLFQSLLLNHCQIPDLYFMLIALLLGNRIRNIPENLKFEFESVCNFLFGNSADQANLSNKPSSGSIWSSGPIGGLLNRIDSQSGVLKKGGMTKKPVEMCPEAATILLSMMKIMLDQTDPDSSGDSTVWIRDYPITLLRFFVYLYHSNLEFQFIAMQQDFLVGLTTAMFPPCENACQNTGERSVQGLANIDRLEKNDENNENYKTCEISIDSINALPARKLIMDFFKMIVVDYFTLPPRNSVQHIIDIILESEINVSTPDHVRQFQTVFVNSLAEHFLAVDILSGQNLPLPTGGSYSYVPNNIFFFISRVVDRLWQDMYTDDPNIILSFIIRLIAQGRKRQISLDSLYRSFNRAILYLLYKISFQIPQKHRILNTMQRMLKSDSMNYGMYLFGNTNADVEFFACLMQLLIQHINGINIVGGSTWYSSDTVRLDSESYANKDSSQIISETIRQHAVDIWKELYDTKKQILEDYFKTSLTNNLSSVYPNVEQVCVKTWSSYLESESNGTASSHWGKVSFVNKDTGSNSSSNVSHSLQHQISVKFNRMSRSNVLSRLSSSNSISTSGSTASGAFLPSIGASKQLSPVSLEDAKLWIPPHISVVKELMDYYKNDFIKKNSFMMYYLESKWKNIEMELTRERSIWGPLIKNSIDKWMLDSTEGPCRMRKKMIPNEYFFKHYPFRQQMLSDSNESGCQVRKFRAASSQDSQLHFYFSMSRTILQEPTYVDKLNSEEYDISSTKISADDSINCSSEDPEDALRTTESILRGRRTSCDIRKEYETPITADDDMNDPKQKFDEDADIDDDTIKDIRHSNTIDDSDLLFSENPISPDPKPKKSTSENSTDSSLQISNAKSRESFKNKPVAQSQWDNQAAIEHLIGSDEKIHFMFRCARIQGLDVHEGLLLFGQNHFYIIDGFTLLKTREIVEIESIPGDVHEPIVPPASSSASQSHGQKRIMNEKFLFDEIREIHKRRYLLQPIAVEVFLADGRNFLLAFPKKMQNKIYAKFMQVSPSLTSNAQQTISGQRQNYKIESGSAGIFSSIMGEKSVTQRWEKGEISNFQYLMHLNTLAGRSYNDLMQYPVFPWILADYDNETLDLSDPATFRQLNKPMGAQSENRLRQFEKRYREWDDPSGETPPYHYGTHYSSAMIVAFYMVRMEPFTQHFLKLQGGHFDLADRMFHSIKDTWESASQHNMADIKELIPEFFYLPNFLKNSNKYDLGCKQNGIVLGDVVLPPWAKGDPHEFIRAHREALECDYVSAHLHEWIDLIFGYKQIGEPAVDAVNVFHHLFYEGNVDIYSIDDPLKRSAVVGFINNFGQIPKQLFKKPHPAKKITIPHPLSNKQIDPMSPMPSSILAEKLFYHNLDNLEPSLQPVRELKNSVGQIIQIDSSGTSTNVSSSVSSGNVLAVEQNKCLIPPSYTRYVAWGFSDGSLRIGNYESDKLIKVYEMPDPYGDIMCVVCPNERTLITGGVSTVVRVWCMAPVTNKSSASSTRFSGNLASSLTLLSNLYGHTESITCLAVAASFNILVSGSRDRTCIMWDLGRLCFLRQLGDHAAPVAAICVSEVSGTVASCAGTYLHIWSIDGEELASVNTATGRSKQILTVSMSTMMDWDTGNVIITGGTDGVVRMWSLEYVQVPESSQCSTTHSSAELSSPQVNCATGQNESVSSYGENSCLDEEEFEPDTTKCAEDKTATLTRSKSGYSSDNCDEYVVIGSSEIESAQLSEAVKSRPSVRSKSSATMLKSLSQAYLVKDLQKLRKGFQWQRQLIFRSKLTMHTAYERSDNANPSPVSSIAVSKDHRSIYVGDNKGRVFYWSVPNEPGRSMADHWIPDEKAEMCTTCRVKFSLTERRHHCRNCGLVFCNRCSKYEIEIHRLRLFKPVRVCVKCFETLSNQQTNKSV